jgi:hypothetical protein
MADQDRYDIEFAHGEQYAVVFELQNQDGTAQDLTGTVVEFVVRRTESSTGTPLLKLTSGVVSTEGSLTVDAPAGAVTVVVNASITRTLPSSRWALWLDPAAEDADLILTGQVQPAKVVQP